QGVCHRARYDLPLQPYTAVRQHSHRNWRKRDAHGERPASQRDFQHICFAAPGVPPIPEHLQTETGQWVTSHPCRELTCLPSHETFPPPPVGSLNTEPPFVDRRLPRN